MFTADNTVFRGTARYDGGPAIGEGFAMFTIDTTAGATSITFPEDAANAEPVTPPSGNDSGDSNT